MSVQERREMSKRQFPKAEPVDRDMASPLDFAVAQRDRETMSMVRRAVARHDVVLAFQPVMQTARPDRPAFYEGLIRVLDENGRIIPAKDFIQTTETSELGRQLDCLALEMGLTSLAEDPTLRLAVNMSARSIGYPHWLTTLNRGLALDDTIGERLILEITESSAMMMPELVIVFMQDLQARGVSFALSGRVTPRSATCANSFSTSSRSTASSSAALPATPTIRC
jgi:sensor c-di-GMP phosphodiesterase-like protein